MQKILIGALMVLAANLTHADANAQPDCAAQIDEYIELVVAPADRTADPVEPSTRTSATHNAAAPVDCAVTPYAGTCDEADGVANAY
jgi:hypothetical protein